MLKRGIFILPLLLFGLHVCAQQVSRNVLVGAGSVVYSGGYFISQTIGEPMVEIIGNEYYVVTQGFQQPSASKIQDYEETGNGAKVYPNPVRQYLTLELYGEQELEYHVTIIGLNGTIYFKENYPCPLQFHYVNTIDVSHYQRGTYFVKVETECGTISRVFKIEKM